MFSLGLVLHQQQVCLSALPSLAALALQLGAEHQHRHILQYLLSLRSRNQGIRKVLRFIL